MNFRKLLTYFAFGTAAVMPFATAQNPTILQGNYISNVFGNSNFVLNPNAQTNTANVTNATRSTTTPLVATSEFTLNLTSGSFATWTLRAFDSGMKGQNCEARFTYRGFATATSTAQIVQNNLVVAQLVLTPTTDPRIASINFPCGDLVNATTFRIAQTTANMTTVTPNEIGGIYVGLATNMANVAQAEFVGGGEWTSSVVFSRSAASAQSTFSPYTSGSTGTALGTATSAGSDTTVTFPNLPAGNYFVTSNLQQYLSNQTTSADCKWSIQEIDSNTYNGQSFSGNVWQSGTIYPASGNMTASFRFTSSGQRRFRIVSTNLVAAGATSSCVSSVDTTSNKAGIYVYRFPSSSELVVTPERQNVWGTASWSGANLFQYFGTAEPTGFLSYVKSGSFSGSYNGSAKAPLSTDQLGFSVDYLPVGRYLMRINQGLVAAPGSTSGNNVICEFRLRETVTNTPIGLSQQTSTRQASLDYISFDDTSLVAVFNNTSAGQRNFIYEANKLYDDNSTNNGQCGARTLTGSGTSTTRPIVFTLQPLDQPSNSALYVQGPVKAAETGAAIPSGYQFENFYGSQYSGSYTNNTWLSLASTTLTPGLWQVEAACMMRNNTSSATTGWSFSAVSISDNNSDQGTDTNPHSYQYRQPSATGISQYDFLTVKRVLYVTSTTQRYLNIYSSWTGGGTPTYTCQFFVMRLN